MRKFEELEVVKSEKMKGGIYLLKEFYAEPKKQIVFRWEESIFLIE